MPRVFTIDGAGTHVYGVPYLGQDAPVEDRLAVLEREQRGLKIFTVIVATLVLLDLGLTLWARSR